MQKFKWTVEFEIDETFVADGFEITQESALDMLSKALPFAYDTEIGARVIKAPTKAAIRKAQKGD